MKLKLGEKIYEYRRKMNMTQKQFAEKLGVSYQSVSRWENEQTYPDIELIPSIADIFKISIDSLMGIEEIERKNQANAIFDSFRHEANKQDFDVEKAKNLLCEIRRDFIDIENSWYSWTRDNDKFLSHPKILPEVRNVAEAYFSINPVDHAVLQTMAYIEDEKNIESFLKKHSTIVNNSKHELLFKRYLRKGDNEKLEPERRYKFFESVITLLQPCVLCGLNEDEEINNAVMDFQINLLRLIRDYSDNDNLDIWVYYRIDLGIKRAKFLSKNGNLDEAIEQLKSTIFLLERTMRISEKQILTTSCRWLDDMVWNAEEKWCQKENKPDLDDERAIYIFARLGEIEMCNLIFPSTYYDRILSFDNNIKSIPEYKKLLKRLKELIKTRPHNDMHPKR